MDHELIYVHRGVYRNLTVEVTLELLFADAAGRVVRQQLGEALDTHGVVAQAQKQGFKLKASSSS